MNSEQLYDILNLFLYTTILLSLPILLVSLVVGLLISIFQAATQINESTLSFLPKMAAITVVLVVMAPWMLRKMDDFTHQVYDKIPLIIKKN
jgi:flagellar biosynthetic protein FliQ